eukprot:PLAT6430.1.p1 GENE.PLAT6430.1~~PLAT6430.1.p1  ORF type:complete len:347 (-),score=168.56 PLAT6430.1:100-1113(-)
MDGSATSVALIPLCLAFTAGLLAAGTPVGALLAAALRSLLAAPLRAGRRVEALYDEDAALLNASVRGGWQNVGYWRNVPARSQQPDAGLRFVTAARALAELLAEAAQLREGQRLLDVGCGCGDQLLLWDELARPAAVVGVNPAAAQAAVAQRKICAAKRQHTLSVLPLTAAAACAKQQAASFDRVLSLDAAYHFRSRLAFFHSARRVLRADGRFACTDQCVTAVAARGGWRWLLLRVLAAVSSIPAANLVTVEEYRRQLRQAGFVDIHMRQLAAEDVYLPLADCIQQQHDCLAPIVAPRLWLFFFVSAAGFRLLATLQLMHYVVVSARCAPPHDGAK